MSTFSNVRRFGKSLACVVLITAGVLAQQDPGPRGGPPGAGGTFPRLDPNPATNQADNDFFLQTLERFKEVDSVSSTIENGNGLGPAFNHNSCAACHVQPAVGGSSPTANPQVVNNFAHLHGASNPVNTSQFLRANGPIREVRFVSTDPTDNHAALDGGVHDIFSIAGRTDAPGCNFQQPDFPSQIAQGNVTFRIPTPLFGAGLVENTPDETLVDNLNSTASQRAGLGIGGRFNTNGNDGTITRFGWKAQNKSLLLFAGEAYNVEQGVTNELFQSDRFPPGTPDSVVANCTFNTSPEDATNIINGQANTIVGGVTKPNPNLGKPLGTASEMSSDLGNFAGFMRLLAPPAPATHTASELRGQALFSQIGCNLCHSTSLKTDIKNGHGINGGSDANFPGAMAGVTYHPFSDFAIHHMGSTLTDGTNQGGAGPDEFRTAPLWGVGQRIFFLHDGRTNDLLAAIQAHFSSGDVCVVSQIFQQFSINGGTSFFQPFSVSQNCGSEANQVITAFNALSGGPTGQQQDVLNFLRSL